MLDAGEPAGAHQVKPTCATILYTGHNDGRVRVWTADTLVPQLQATVPFDSGGAGPKLKSVTVIKVGQPVLS